MKLQEKLKIALIEWDTDVYPAIRNQFKDFKKFGTDFLHNYEAISNKLIILTEGKMDEDIIDYNQGFSKISSLFHFMETKYEKYRKGIDETVCTIFNFKTVLDQEILQKMTKMIQQLREPNGEDSDDSKLINNSEHLTTDVEKILKSVETLMNKLNIIIEQCGTLLQQWNGIERYM